MYRVAFGLETNFEEPQSPTRCPSEEVGPCSAPELCLSRLSTSYPLLVFISHPSRGMDQTLHTNISQLDQEMSQNVNQPGDSELGDKHRDIPCQSEGMSLPKFKCIPYPLYHPYTGDDRNHQILHAPMILWSTISPACNPVSMNWNGHQILHAPMTPRPWTSPARNPVSTNWNGRCMTFHTTALSLLTNL